ncbi:MAG: hypothetical protein V1759_04070 [bacterium]
MTATDGSEHPIKPNEFYFMTKLPNGQNLVVEFNYASEKARGIVYGEQKNTLGEDDSIAVCFKGVESDVLIKLVKKGIKSRFDLEEKTESFRAAKKEYDKFSSKSRRDINDLISVSLG